MLTKLPWHGNVRELISIIRRLCAVESEEVISTEALQKHCLSGIISKTHSISLPLSDDLVIELREPIDLMGELRNLKTKIIEDIFPRFNTIRELAAFLGFNSDSALRKHYPSRGAKNQ
jgi:DNA-binding NtrC family response regulator